MTYYLIEESQPYYIGHTVEDNRPLFTTFTLAKRYFVAVCQDTLAHARLSAHSSFVWVYSQPPSGMTLKKLKEGDRYVSIDIKGGSYNGPYSNLWITKKDYRATNGPIIRTKEELDKLLEEDYLY